VRQQFGSDVLGILWMLRLDKPLQFDIEPRIPAMFLHAEAEIVGELAEAMRLDDPDPILQRFLKGKHCYIARVEGTIASYGWVTFDEEEIGELGMSIRLKRGEAYIWDCATLPEYRGQHLYPALLAHMVNALKHRGLQRIWIGTDADNLPSQSGVMRVGCHPVLEFIQLQDDGYISRGCSEAATQDVLDANYALFGNCDVSRISFT
jgi:GNAT superfamily N-acetyltransferase